MSSKIITKLSDTFSDIRITPKEWDHIALQVVTQLRDEGLLDKAALFCESFINYRNTVGVGIDNSLPYPLQWRHDEP